MWLKLRLRNRSILVSRVYTPPNSPVKTMKSLLDGIAELSKAPKYSGTELDILGDFKINVYSSPNSPAFCSFMRSLDFKDCIIGPTRVASVTCDE